MSNLQELTTIIRTARNDHKVNPKQSVSAVLVVPESALTTVDSHRSIIEALATCKVVSVVATLASAPAGATRITAGRFEVYIEGLVDPAAEQQRNTKRREELVKSIAAMKGRLGNAGYIAKAPPHLVQQTQDQLAAAETELASLG
jgi:valyl-tRNA synthetase